MKSRPLFPLLFLLTACTAIHSIGTQFKPMVEPQDGDRARVRVSANMLVRGSPNTSCMDWNSEQTGTILGGIVGSKGFRDRSLGIPDPNHSKARDYAEFYVRTGEPFTLMLTNTPESRMTCSVGATFIPDKDHDYEFVLLTAMRGSLSSQCSVQAYDVTGGQSTPIAISEARSCH
ncbi:hypothetical protein [Cardiobacterium valvarum]|nr:hypothetical protein [Cardiobacterium valvarum]